MNQHNIFSRVAQLDKIVVRHPALQNALLGIKECVTKTHFYREPMGSLLLAEGGMGKTTVCRSILAEMPESIKVDSNMSRTLVPAFYASVPSPASVKSVAASLLAKLNDPSPLAGTTAHMTTRLCHLLAICETKLVFLDEFHHLFDVQRTTTRINLQVCNWIKSLVNSSKVSFCLVGTPTFAPILASDSQLARRFPIQFLLNPFTAGTNEYPGTLAPFLNEIREYSMQQLELKAFPHFGEEHIINQIYIATGGNPSFIMSLIKESILNALTSGTNTVCLKNFSAAWEKGITSQATLSKNNPFLMSPGSLAGIIRGNL